MPRLTVFRINTWFKTSVGIAALLVGQAGYAQDNQTAKSSSDVLEEIVVTAQKREATLLETPVALSVVGGSTLSIAQIRDMKDLQTLVPSLQIGQRASASNTTIAIRSIGSSTFNFGIEPAVGVFVDGVYRARNGASVNDFLGVERVEVLRGPQSTLFGKNTTGGVVHFITKEPDYDLGVEAELTYGNFDTTAAKAALNMPLVDDTLAMRLDANINKRDGHIENVDGRDLNGRDRYGLRAQMLYEPNTDVKVRLIADYNDLSEECCAAPFYLITPETQFILTALGSSIVGPADPTNRQTAINGAVQADLETMGISAQVDIDYENFTLTSITSYRSYDEEQDIDADFSDLLLNNRRLVLQDYKTFTQEFRLASDNDSALQWIVGAYYYNQDLGTTNSTIQGAALRPFADFLSGGQIDVLEAALGVPNGTFLADGSGQLASTFNQDDEAYALFAQADWYVTDKLTLTAGVRYTHEKKSFDTDININDPFAALNFVDIFIAQAVSQGVPLETAQVLAQDPATNPFLALTQIQFFPPSDDITDSKKDNAISGTVILDYAFSDQVTMYASYSRGFKAGGFALDSSATRVGSFDFDKETSDAFELGLKTRLMDNRMALNFALFDQSVNDFQENVFTGSAFVPDNAGKIKVRGLEFDGVFKASANLLMTAGFTWLFDAKYASFPNGPCPSSAVLTDCTLVPVAGGLPRFVQDLSGDRLSESSKFTGNVTALYTQDISDKLEIFVRGELFYKSYQNLATSGDPLQFQDGYALAAASTGVGSVDGTWQLRFWARNLFDKGYVVDTFEATVPGDSINAYVGAPRTLGVTLKLKY